MSASAVPLDLPRVRHSFYAMSNALTEAVKRALDRAPCSVATLARVAGVPQSTLARIQAGERNATVAVAHAVTRALEQWSADCRSLARGIRRAQPRRAQ